MAATALGEGPKTLSLAPIRVLIVKPVRRCKDSGPTKGTVDGSLSIIGVKADMVGLYPNRLMTFNENWRSGR
jgi:hypothetical protein